MLFKKKFVLVVLFAVGAVAFYCLVLQLTGNFHTVVKDEVYRSAQMDTDNLKEYSSKYKIRSVINLRGENIGKKWYDDELREAERLNIKHVDFRMSAAKELTKEQVLELVNIMRNAPKPMLIHCKAGADRTGLAAAFYVAAINHGSEFASELQLSPLYGHIGLWVNSVYAMNRTFEAMEPYLGYVGS